MRGQAAIFDAITFLLLVSFSVGMIYVFLADYGNPQDRTIRSAHVLNYLQALTKSLFFIDANSVSQVQPYVDAQGKNRGPDCSALAGYPASISISDLLKSDVSDRVLDDHVHDVNGASYSGALKPGLTAARCAIKELMKPFTTGGFYYYAEIVDPSLATGSCLASNAIRQPGERMTNYFEAKICGCDDSALAGVPLLTVAAPFRALAPTKVQLSEYNNTAELFVFRVCIWQQSRSAKPPGGLGG